MRSATNNAPLEGRELSGPPKVLLLLLVLRGVLIIGLTPKATLVPLLLLSFAFLEGLTLLVHHDLTPLHQTG